MQKKILTLVADYTVSGPLAYLSHQETLTMFQRCFVRAHVPMVYSQGFNPRPSISIPLPRSVGVASSAERVCVLIETPEATPLEAVEIPEIQSHLPAGCTLLSTAVYPEKKTFRPLKANYVFSLNTAGIDSNRFEMCEKDLLSGQSILINRYSLKKRRTLQVDISMFIESIHFKNPEIAVLCNILPAGTVRIEEIMNWLGLEQQSLSGPVRRTLIQWSQD